MGLFVTVKTIWEHWIKVQSCQEAKGWPLSLKSIFCCTWKWAAQLWHTGMQRRSTDGLGPRDSSPSFPLVNPESPGIIRVAFRTPRSWHTNPVCIQIYTHTHTHACTHMQTRCQFVNYLLINTADKDYWSFPLAWSAHSLGMRHMSSVSKSCLLEEALGTLTRSGARRTTAQCLCKPPFP